MFLCTGCPRKNTLIKFDLDKLADELKQGKEEAEGEEGRLFYRIVDHVPSNCATGLVDEQGNCRSPWG